MPRTQTKTNPIQVPNAEYSLRIQEAVRQFKSVYLRKVLKLHGGNISQTAKTIGVSRRTLQLQLKEVGIQMFLRERAQTKTAQERLADEVGA